MQYKGNFNGIRTRNFDGLSLVARWVVSGKERVFQEKRGNKQYDRSFFAWQGVFDGVVGAEMSFIQKTRSGYSAWSLHRLNKVGTINICSMRYRMLHWCYIEYVSVLPNVQHRIQQ